MWGSVHAPFSLRRFLLRFLCAATGFTSWYAGQPSPPGETKAAQGSSEPGRADRFVCWREGAMRTSRLAAHKAKLLLIDSHNNGYTRVEEEPEPRPEMLCFRADAGAHTPLLRNFIASWACFLAAGARVLPLACLPSRHSKLRGTGRLRSRCGALHGKAHASTH